MVTTLFDDLADVYEAMIDWTKRLAHEEPFFRRWFEAAGVQSVVDVACGTGRHAAMFHSWHLRVEGADASPDMIRKAKDRAGEPPGLHWVVRNFSEPVLPPASFDAVVCVGNSLALAADAAAAEQAVGQMLAAIRKGGIVLLQVLNLWQFADGPCVWQRCKLVPLPPGKGLMFPEERLGLPDEWLVLKGVHRCGTRGYVDLVVADPRGGPTLWGESAPILGFEADDLERMARSAGAAELHLFGSYQETPYDRTQSPDLILVARKG